MTLQLTMLYALWYHVTFETHVANLCIPHGNVSSPFKYSLWHSHLVFSLQEGLFLLFLKVSYIYRICNIHMVTRGESILIVKNAHVVDHLKKPEDVAVAIWSLNQRCMEWQVVGLIKLKEFTGLAEGEEIVSALYTLGVTRVHLVGDHLVQASFTVSPVNNL